MPSLDPLHPLQSCVLELLAAEGSLRVTDLRKKLQSVHNLDVTLPTLYRLLAQLTYEQVIVRSKGTITLNAFWVSHLARFVERAKQRHLTAGDPSLDLHNLQEKEVRSYVADSLLALDPIWNHVILEIAHLADAREWYSYNSHPWYSIVQWDTEVRLYQSLVAEGIKCHMLYGNDTFLDRYGEKMIRVDGFETARATKAPLLPEGHALWCCGSYIIECVMPEAISMHFALFFRMVQSIGQFDPQLFIDVFRMRARCKLSVRKDAQESQRIRSMMKPFFQKEKITA